MTTFFHPPTSKLDEIRRTKIHTGEGAFLYPPTRRPAIITKFDDPILGIPGIRFLLDSSDLATITLNQTPGFLTNITQWDDKVQGLNISNPTTLEQPKLILNGLNGKPVVRYDGDDWLSRVNVLGSDLFSPSELTIITVNKEDFIQASRIFYWKDPGNTKSVNINAPWIDGFIYFDAPYPLGRIAQGGHGEKLGPAIWGFVKESNTFSQVYYQGLPLFGNVHTSAQISVNESFELFIGDNGNFYVGDIAEIIVFNRKLTTDELNFVFDTLKTKWGL